MPPIALSARATLALAAMVVAPTPAFANDWCVDRPGLGTPTCTLPAGTVLIEVGAGRWDHDSESGTTKDTVTLGDFLVRAGIDAQTEFGVGLTSLGVEREKNLLTGAVTRQTAPGDMIITARRSLTGPAGLIALHAFVTLPTGRQPTGAGDWSAGILVPINIKLPDDFELDLTPEADAAVNASGNGRHLAWGGVVGMSHPIGRALSVEAEIGIRRDLDPAGSQTQTTAALSLAWQISQNWQIDLEADAGLTAGVPQRSVAIGFAHRF